MPTKILNKTLKKLHLIRTCDDGVVPDGNIKGKQTVESYVSIPQVLDSDFLNLPLDIFNLIMSNLSYADIVSLSLTTKALRHICPDPSSKGDPGLYCRDRIYGRCLPNANSTSSSSSKRSTFNRKTKPMVDRNRWEGNCSYCSHKLCPPTCPSALILDHRTGIFYPASLYPFESATPAPTSGFPETSGSRERFIPGDARLHRAWDNSPSGTYYEPMYKTIWCEHHRCPPSLMKDNYAKEDASMGAYRFYGNYYANGDWAVVRDGPPKTRADSPYVIPHTRFLAGYRNTPLDEPKRTSRPSSASQTTVVEPLHNVVKFYKLNLNNGLDPSFDPERDQDPIDEPFFYDTLCRHCFLPLRRSDGPGTFWSRRTCICAERCPFQSKLYVQTTGPTLGRPGCSNCGIISVKFTIIEAFIPVPAYNSHIHFSLVLASEMQIGSYRPHLEDIRLRPGPYQRRAPRSRPGSTSRPMTMQRRLFYLEPEKHQKSLNIIRYELLIPLPPKTTRGFQNLPPAIINRIFSYVLCNTRYRKPRYIPEARRLILQGRTDWSWNNFHNSMGTCLECRRFKSMDREVRLRSTWRCTEECNYGFHMFMTKGSMRGH
ncbi:hypothetical protein TWF481_001452 [Arthrobotrys musiformis]|uniref:F-box domain-containing protein n=1 Tax=Arthrobotrys musiformis TaxID=47236 RepID=A0AAV9WRP3_9PEZI